ncbi:MAG TPA: hypothetical protein VML95_06765 [Longimicrobiales bacterium]|nr:hypothetical protein [Longimicrobiales bacterium]
MTRGAFARRTAIGIALALSAPAAAAGAPVQGPSAAFATDSATVGDPVLLVLRVPHDAGETVRFPDSLAVSGEVEFLGPASVPAEDGLPGVASAAYRVTAWRPGEHELPPIRIRVDGSGGTRTVRLEPPPLRIASVLPADSAEVEPRPPKDVLGPNRTILPTLLLVAVLVAAGIALARWLIRRKRRLSGASVAVVPPGTKALDELDRIHTSGLLEKGEVKLFYVLTTRVLRDYLNSVEPAWGAGLTTAEIDAHIDPALRPLEKRDLLTVLFRADRVKFARHRPGASEPEELWEAARAWVVGHEDERARRQAEATAAAAAAEKAS